MNKLGIYFFIFIFGLSFVYSEERTQIIRTDHSDRGQPLTQIKEFEELRSKRLLPIALIEFLPDPNIITKYLGWVTGDNFSAQAPALGSVYYILEVLSGGFTGVNTDGILWKICMGFILLGIFTSFYFGVKNVLIGKGNFENSIIPVITKSLTIIILVVVIIPFIPKFIVYTCDLMTKNIIGIDTVLEEPNYQGIKNYYMKKYAGAAATIQENLNNVYELLVSMSSSTNDQGMSQKYIEVWNTILADPVIKKITQELNEEGVRQKVEQKMKRIKQNISERDAINYINDDKKQELSREIMKYIQLLHSRILLNAREVLKKTSEEMSKNVESEILKTLKKTNYASYGKIGRYIEVAAYIAYVQFAISIWGIAYGSLIWTVFFSFPNEFQLSGALSNGAKLIVVVIMTCYLITVYTSSSIRYEKFRIDTSIKNIFDFNIFDIWDVTNKIQENFGIQNTAGGSAIQRLKSLAGITVEDLLIALLISTASLQAMTIVQGGGLLSQHISNLMQSAAIKQSAILPDPIPSKLFSDSQIRKNFS